MSTARFDAFQQAVDALAARLGKQGASAADAPVPVPVPLQVDGLVVVYAQDDAARTLTLVDISRESATSR
ncbi:hypothetical protein [Pyxidicoccus xibeiensis]|uniref:hypothetical protein n=1 Tax=Pyxidicoccus xibeiensis TaxID=2906759 RepID=UPI0020A75AA4|nr:hypothetical protein [Pyxidicoccus xibeiensis]MCP3139614.1 hypothetical protein [Pyxidicoccus xibeiensis]